MYPGRKDNYRGRYVERRDRKFDKVPFRNYNGRHLKDSRDNNKIRKNYYSNNTNNNYNNSITRIEQHFESNFEKKNEPVDDEKPIPIDLRPSGILTKYLHLLPATSENIIITNSKSKYAPPEDEIIPTADNCNIHLFKYNEELDKQIEIPLYNYKSYFIFGRDAEISDIILSDEEDGDVVSKQHAVIQFRESKEDKSKVKCYLMDLGSTNGTFLNDDKVELPTKRYIELKNNDFFKLGDYDSIIEFMILED